MKRRKDSAAPVPEPMRVQLTKLFGAQSREATASCRTDREWRRTFRHVLNELEKYVDANIATDRPHREMIGWTFDAAHISLEQESFYIPYIEALTRLALLLMGEYPDHRRRKGGGKREDHYNLQLCRSVHFTRNSGQRRSTLIAAQRLGLPNCEKDPLRALSEFRKAYGYKVGHEVFLGWFAQNYPLQYASTFEATSRFFLLPTAAYGEPRNDG